MKARLLFTVLCLMPIAANAAIPYRVEQRGVRNDTPAGYDNEAFARVRRFYIGGAYNFSLWQSGTDQDVHADGKNTSSYEAAAGVRIFDTFRVEANYIRTNAKWDAFKLTGDTVMLNALFDARIDNIYRMFRKQTMIPYVGIGAGASFNRADNADIDNKTTPVMAALAGIGIEMGDRVTLDLGYRYFYMFKPGFDTMPDFAPAAHQFRAGARLNF